MIEINANVKGFFWAGETELLVVLEPNRIKKFNKIQGSWREKKLSQNEELLLSCYIENCNSSVLPDNITPILSE